jgi:hypothetical protein
LIFLNNFLPRIVEWVSLCSCNFFFEVIGGIVHQWIVNNDGF